MFTKTEFMVLLFLVAFALLGGILRLIKEPEPAGKAALIDNAFPVYSSKTIENNRPEPGPNRSLPQTRLNINTASMDKLVKLKGVGPVTARKILEYRKQSGPFNRPEDLMRIKGIGPKKFKGLAPLITI